MLFIGADAAEAALPQQRAGRPDSLAYIRRGVGVGANGDELAANKVKGIRCALCSEPLSAEMTRRHNDANMLAMGGGLIGNNMADRIVDAFLNTPFEGGRHQRRVDKIEG